MTTRELREERRSAAERYKPARVRLLLIAEAPPAAPDRYFYFADVPAHDSLFRYVTRLVLGEEPTRRNKPDLLAKLRDRGVYLIDVCLDPILDKRDLKACTDDAVARATALMPDRIILIKRTVYDAAYGPMKKARLPVVDAMVPFPGSGQQLRFEVEMRRALDSIGWPRPTQ